MKGFKTKCLKQVVSLLLSAAMIGTSITASADTIVDAGEVEALGEDDVYVLDGADCTLSSKDAQGKYVKESRREVAGTDGYFTIVGDANSSAAYKCEDKVTSFSDGYKSVNRINPGTDVTKNHVAFTTSKKAVLKVWWTDNTQLISSILKVVNAAGEEVAYEKGTETDPPCEKTNAYQNGGSSGDKWPSNNHISTIELDTPGEYHVGGTSGTTYIFKMEVTEKGAAAGTASSSAFTVDFVSTFASKAASDTSGTVELTAEEKTVAATEGEGSVTLEGKAQVKTDKKGNAIGIELAKSSTAGAYDGKLTFTTEGLAKVVINAMSTNGTNSSTFVLLNGEDTVDEYNMTSTVTGATATKLTYYVAAGTYSFAVPSTAARGVRVASISIEPVAKIPTAYWLKGAVTCSDSAVKYDNIKDVTLNVQPLDAAHAATGQAITAKLTKEGTLATYAVKVSADTAYAVTSNLGDYYTVNGEDTYTSADKTISNAVICTTDAISTSNVLDIELVPNSAKYTVTFKAATESAVEANVFNRFLVNAPTVATEDAKGRTFIGWYDADGNRFDEANAVKASVTYNAKYAFAEFATILGDTTWSAKKTYGDITGISFRVCEDFALHTENWEDSATGHKGTYFVQGTSNGTALTVGDAFPALNSASASVIFTAKEDGTVTIYSKPTAKTYFFADSTDNGETIASMKTGSTIPYVLTFDVKKGHSYCYKASGSKPMIEKIELLAQFEEKPLPKHDVTFVDTDGEEVAAATRVREQQPVNKPDSVTYKNVKADENGVYAITSGSAVTLYKFAGWINASGAAITFPVTMGTEDVAFTATFIDVTPKTGTNENGDTVVKNDDLTEEKVGLPVAEVNAKNEAGDTIDFKIVGLQASYVEAAGQKIEPAFDLYRIDGVGVTATATLLVKNVDYKVTFKDNSKVGGAKVYIKGAGKYAGELEIKGGFKIVTVADGIEALNAKLGTDYKQGFKVLTAKVTGKPVYTGAEITTGAGIVVTDKASKAALVEGTDYIVEYVNNVDAGKAVATVIGIGQYCGSAKAGFKISPVTVKGIESKFAIDNKEITVADTAKNAVIDGIEVKYDGTTLTYGKDYTASVKMGKNGADLTVKFNSKGNFKGAIKKTVTASKLDVADLYVFAGDLVAGEDIYKAPVFIFDKNGTKVKYALCADAASAKASKTGVGVVIVDEAGKPVAKGTKAVKDAQYCYEVYGSGNYEGETCADVTASATKTLTKSKVSILSKVYYTGNEVELPTVRYDKTKKTGFVITTADKKELKTSDENTKFVVDYFNNVNPGTATVVITGVGENGGVAVATMKINAMTFAKGTLLK